jgi:hypothetical protein
MERRMIRLSLVGALVMTFALLAVGIHASCPTYADCPMHGQNSNITGHTKYENGHQWSEFICRASGDGPHTFWVQCD